jgi:ferric-dicitrate binding protein FerR (iron transport regulator)
MNDEPRLLEIDSRVRAALRTDDATCRAMVARALAVAPRTPPPRWRRTFAMAAAAALALLLVVAALAWRRGAGGSRSPSITVTSAGPVLVVQSEDGRRWIVGPSMPRGSGSYAMVVTE